jgi:hypothetical protein
VIALLVSARSHTKLLSFSLFFATTIFVAVQMVVTSAADCSPDELAIRKIIGEEVAAWNSGDAAAYSRHFAPKATFTNIYRMVFEGHDAFEKRHAETFATSQCASGNDSKHPIGHTPAARLGRVQP